MDRTDGSLPDDARQELKDIRARYHDALRDWVAKGRESTYIQGDNGNPPPAEHALASTHFALGQHLYRTGHHDEGLRHMDRAIELAPESWAFRRQRWDLEEKGKSGGPEFWSAVEALGDRRYYPELTNLPPTQPGRRCLARRSRRPR
ncbi:MAG: tetratricopeptide repeat protein [Dehalococcoidia bacterium]|nr:tetratricopeptide repeat protein [Dehalococcoidia bacterium]